MKITLERVSGHDLPQYKRDMQEAFQKGFETKYGRTQALILPEADIDGAVNAKGAVAYKAVMEGEMVGGAVVTIDDQTRHNHLELLYVKHGVQSKGVGTKLWFEIEKLYPETKVWETCTPYFERRNIHFYVNVCGFHIVEFFNEKHPMPGISEDFMGDGQEGFFEFRKEMKPED